MVEVSAAPALALGTSCFTRNMGTPGRCAPRSLASCTRQGRSSGRSVFQTISARTLAYGQPRVRSVGLAPGLRACVLGPGSTKGLYVGESLQLHP